ncbi:glycerol-3-phosphate dehydrogenase [NAD(+)], cytoplasmic-like [Ochlerotatus camptorhynchus]|uniref:glycerol-3-phosphate dehydrogenase [NAD(+)], cytoplasmic-like n=1 Tax=Ochlerotatus camptorhynchus TaxID=644619 RepID=UPI0031D21D04
MPNVFRTSTTGSPCRYVFEEMIDSKKLTEIINTTHENVKYLPEHKLPENVIAVPDFVEAAKDADILIFVVPHQFIQGLGTQLLGKIKPTAVGLSWIKGSDVAEGGDMELISHIITKHLKIPCSVLMGANLAGEVAEKKCYETTIGCRDMKMAQTLRDLFQKATHSSERPNRQFELIKSRISNFLAEEAYFA